MFPWTTYNFIKGNHFSVSVDEIMFVCDPGTPAKEDLIKAYPFHMNQENNVQNISTKTTKNMFNL